MSKTKSKEAQIARMQESAVDDWLSTGCTLLDLAISNRLGGIPAGRSTHIYGWESTAKSVLAQEPLGAAQRKGGHVWYLDAEQTLDFERAKNLFGLDVDADTFHYAVPETIEELFDGSQVNKTYKWGIYDMHGNAQEWVLDSCKWRNFWRTRVGVVTDTYKDNIVDPLSQIGNHKIIRGGGWYQTSKYQRSAYRSYYKPGVKRNSLGFRIVRMQ